MALIGPHGEQHSHLSKRDVADPALAPRRAQRPIKGTWVGTRRDEDPADYTQRYLAEQAEANMTAHEEAVLKATAAQKQEVPLGEIAAVVARKVEARHKAVEGIVVILEYDLLPDQRRILTQALGVVAMLP